MTRLIETESSPLPKNAEALAFEAADGVSLRGAFFSAENARGTVVLVTGWSEFIEKYYETIDNLRERSLNVAMMDWRGQGLSDRESARASNWKNYFRTLSNDLRHFTEQHVKQRFTGPYFLMTHSMGGMPALMLLASGYPGFERAILCAPMTQLFPEPQNRITAFAAMLASNLGFAKAQVYRKTDHADTFEGNIFTSDETRHRRFYDLRIAAPEAASAAPTYGWVHAAMKASREIHTPGALAGVTTPTLIITAGEEQQIDGADHAVIADMSKNIQQAVISGALHEVMMERDELRDAYFKAVDDFLSPALS